MVPSQFSALVSMLQKTTIKIIIHGEALLIFAFICNVGQLRGCISTQKKNLEKLYLMPHKKNFLSSIKWPFS